MSDTKAMRAMSVHGATVEYDDHGDGEPVLLLHAGVFGAWFVPLAAASTMRGFRVIRMLRAGYTGGPPPEGHLTMADHARHAAALLDALGTGPAHVVAHSSATLIALQLGLDRPDLVRTLTLSEPPLLDSLAAPEDLELLGAAIGPAIGAAMAATAAGDTSAAYDAFMDAVCGPDHRAVLAATLGPDAQARAEQDSRFFFADEVLAANEWRFDEQIASRIPCPVLLVQGGASPAPEHRLVARLAAMLPDAEVTTIDEVNHLLPLTSPEALGALIAGFTARRRGSSR